MVIEVDLYKALSLALSSGALSGVLLMVWHLSAYKAKQESNTRQIVATLRGLVSLIRDDGERRLLEAGLATINSPARLNVAALRELVAQHGRPPAEVVDVIRSTANDAALDEDWKIMGRIAEAFTPEQLEHAYKIHGGSATTFNAMVLLVIGECREFGTDEVLRELGLID